MNDCGLKFAPDFTCGINDKLWHQGRDYNSHGNSVQNELIAVIPFLRELHATGLVNKGNVLLQKATCVIQVRFGLQVSVHKGNKRENAKLRIESRNAKLGRFGEVLATVRGLGDSDSFRPEILRQRAVVAIVLLYVQE